ncbi:hypothetical protein [Tenacibaculum sp. M341]|uniref:hypothetical protein n=1 Tax=Tenacibaculum sp. M341 TaxID=2530339 RepID=UPI00104A9330|nr:hypothetical protein [Tenacibaculum sp. M341]TCI84541.1 hypothetical protein EYW44_21085 [Tenacibaculum sp. M341]
MKKATILLLIFLILQSCKQTKADYLANNRFNVEDTNFEFPQKDFKIIGFGAYHGSVKTEDVELKLLTSLLKSKSIKYYLPETDFSIAHYFNKYLQNGDTLLLKDLVTIYGNRVPQERTIEVYEKWKKLKTINDQLPDQDKLNVVGIDYQVNYKYTSKHILELVNDTKNELAPIQTIQDMVKTDTTSFVLGDLSYAYKVLKDFVNDYETNQDKYNPFISDKKTLDHIVKNIKISFGKEDRETIIYNNYIDLSVVYNFKQTPQFLRMGFAHIKKARDGADGYPYFFTRLIENNIYPKEEIISVIGYFTDSKVVWDEVYDKQGNYTGYTVEAGFGIGDYEKEYFRGIQHLKDSKISDKTLFRLNKKDSPYAINEPDLIEVIMQDEKSNGEAVKGMSTLAFLDYAVLISDSKESIPIYEMNKKE